MLGWARLDTALLLDGRWTRQPNLRFAKTKRPRRRGCGRKIVSLTIRKLLFRNYEKSRKNVLDRILQPNCCSIKNRGVRWIPLQAFSLGSFCGNYERTCWAFQRVMVPHEAAKIPVHQHDQRGAAGGHGRFWELWVHAASNEPRHIRLAVEEYVAASSSSALAKDGSWRTRSTTVCLKTFDSGRYTTKFVIS